MLICIGGLQGSGRRILAGMLASHLGYHYYNQHSHINSLATTSIERKIPDHARDAERLLNGKRIVDDLRVSSKMYPQMVIDRIFHREIQRKTILEGAKKYFDTVIFIWVDHDDDSSQGLILQKSPKKGTAIIERRVESQKNFQPFDASVPVFSYVGAVEDSISSFVSFVQQELSREASKAR